jgi:ABC-type Zn uptake system ZnuABC Zn-binding protein ZnuA
MRHAIPTGIRKLLLSVAVSALLGGGGPPAAAPARPRVVATTVQITALTKAVAGDAIELTGLIPVGADPHEFEPRAGDLIALERATLVLRHGLGLDNWLDRTLRAGRGARTVTVTAGVRLQKAEANGRPVVDPHVWHDPANAKRMVDNIATALGEIDPPRRTTYRANAAAYRQRLDAAAGEVRAILAGIPPARRKLVTDHDALGYFARAFGLRIVGTVIPGTSTQSEPSAGEVAALLETIRREKVTAIFAEASVNSRLAARLAAEAGVKIVDDLYGDSLGVPGSGAETVEGMWLANARRIADALR